MKKAVTGILAGGAIAWLSVPALAGGISHLPLLEAVAPGVEQISPHVPHMGTHWADPATLSQGGPIYCVLEGHVVCVEYMFPAAAFAAGADFTDLVPGFDTPPITHVNIEYKPDGAGPVTDPLYQIHIYFADKAVLAAH